MHKEDLLTQFPVVACTHKINTFYETFVTLCTFQYISHPDQQQVVDRIFWGYFQNESELN